MAINPINFSTSAAATATNGSDIITVTGNTDLRFVYSGSAVFLGTRHVVEAISGTAPDGSGNSEIKLRVPWDQPTTTARLTVFNTIEGLAEAIRRAREVVAGTEAIADELTPLAELTTLGFIERTGTAQYSTFQATAAGKALLGASTVAAQRTALGLGTAATANVTTSPTDTTSGRLLKVGDFGVGSTSFSPDYNVNTTVNGLRHTAVTNGVNLPSFFGSQNAFVLSQGSLGSSNMFQIANRFGSNEIAVRGSATLPWQELYHTGNLEITQSATDTTAERVTKVGDFGVGSVGYRAYPVSDLNASENADVPVGIYSFNTTFDNRPFGDTGVIIVATRSSGEKLNTLITSGTSSPRMLFRRVATGNVGHWQEIYHTGNILGTVSQESGVPTGAIIERGSNSDGGYVKYADGTLKNYGEVAMTPVANEVSTTDVTFSSPYVTTSDLVVTLGTRAIASALIRPATYGSISTTGCVVSIIRSNTTTTQVAYEATGRWFT